MTPWKRAGILFALLSIVGIGGALAEEPKKESTEAQPAAEEPKPRMDIYGHVMLDTGYQAGANDPDWFDVVRPV
jgi:hypothetical protein